MKTNKIKVNIAGNNYTIISDKSEEDVQKIASYVNDEINKITSKNYRLNPTMVSTLVALNISSDLFELKNEIEKINEDSNYPMRIQEDLKKNNEEVLLANSKLENEINIINNNNSILIKTIHDLENRYKKIEETLYNTEVENKKLNSIIIELKDEIIKIKNEYIKRL